MGHGVDGPALAGPEGGVGWRLSVWPRTVGPKRGGGTLPKQNEGQLVKIIGLLKRRKSFAGKGMRSE